MRHRLINPTLGQKLRIVWRRQLGGDASGQAVRPARPLSPESLEPVAYGFRVMWKLRILNRQSHDRERQWTRLRLARPGSAQPLGPAGSVLRRPLEATTTAPTAAATGPPGADFRGRQLAVRFRARGKDAVADFEILQRSGLTFFAERGFVIHHNHHRLIAAAAVHLNRVPVDGSDLTEGTWTATAKSHASAATLAATAAGSTSTALAAARPTHALGPLELFRRHAIDKLSRDLLVAVGVSAHRNVVADFQIFQSQFLRRLLLLTRLPLAVMRLVSDHDGLGCAICLLDLEPINPHGSYSAQHRRRAAETPPALTLARSPALTRTSPLALRWWRRILLRRRERGQT